MMTPNPVPGMIATRVAACANVELPFSFLQARWPALIGFMQRHDHTWPRTRSGISIPAEEEAQTKHDANRQDDSVTSSLSTDSGTYTSSSSSIGIPTVGTSSSTSSSSSTTGGGRTMPEAPEHKSEGEIGVPLRALVIGIVRAIEKIYPRKRRPLRNLNNVRVEDEDVADRAGRELEAAPIAAVRQAGELEMEGDPYAQVPQPPPLTEVSLGFLMWCLIEGGAFLAIALEQYLVEREPLLERDLDDVLIKDYEAYHLAESTPGNSGSTFTTTPAPDRNDHLHAEVDRPLAALSALIFPFEKKVRWERRKYFLMCANAGIRPESPLVRQLPEEICRWITRFL